jgi:cell division ATPase FtsA
MPVRIGAPVGVSGLVDHLLTPAFSTSIGLLRLWEREFRQGEPGRYESAPAGGVVGRLRDWVRNLFP